MADIPTLIAFYQQRIKQAEAEHAIIVSLREQIKAEFKYQALRYESDPVYKDLGLKRIQVKTRVVENTYFLSFLRD